MIEDAIKLTLNTAMPAVANKILDFTDGFFPVPFIKDWVVDWETPEPAAITEISFGIGVKGLMFD